MDDHGYDQAACRRAAELLREEAAYGIGAHATPAVLDVIEWLEGYRA